MSVFYFKWNDRICESDMDLTYLAVDRIRCRIKKLHPFNSIRYFQIFYEAPFPFEIAVRSNLNNVVWSNGLFLAGSYSELKFFKIRLKSILSHSEKLTTECGDRDNKVLTLWQHQDSKVQHGCLRAHHEKFNGCSNSFHFLNSFLVTAAISIIV